MATPGKAAVMHTERTAVHIAARVKAFSSFPAMRIHKDIRHPPAAIDRVSRSRAAYRA
ncbi:hypothetical protein DSCA_24450 [Desulfosarcina alkanivorans]|uniref:Uncharacterized protein n=1 Tax=Desulfosarcina alkanivorans TaxID=571177 RepID=A0A5K7YJC9_9BACT|nr:hypothetical protein DSCA_24450 [Desulfosarcina alkanivorans]